MRNLVLTGLPGSGKSRLGKMLAEKLKVEFYDSDILVEQQSGRSIGDLFAESETCFRTWETGVLQELALLQGAVIATGGGAVLKAENMAALKQKGAVVFLDRNPERIRKDLREDGQRPLLAWNGDRIYELYRKRLPLYEKYADYIVPDGEWQEMFGQLLAIGKEIWQ